MNCAELEILICDYVDGTLAPAEKAEVERHLTACPTCAELARDSAAAVNFIGHGVAEIVAGVRPIIRCASAPTAWTCPDKASCATTEGSDMTIPRPST